MDSTVKGNETATTENGVQSYQERMISLQTEANKRLKGIDNTLDWFFWIMVIGFVCFVLFGVFSGLTSI